MPKVALTRPGLEDAVGEEGRVRVAHHREDRHAVRQRCQPLHGRERTGRGDDRGQGLARDAEELEQLGVPGRAPHVEELGARGVAGLDHVLAAEAAQEPAVDGAEPDGARRWSAARSGSSGRAASAPWRPRTSGRAGDRSGRGSAARWPSERRASQSAAVRWSCQLTSGPSGFPVVGVPGHQRLALVADARPPPRPAGPAPPGRPARPPARWRRSPRRPAPPSPGAGCCSRGRRAAARDHLAALVHQQALGGAGALVDGEDERLVMGPSAEQLAARPSTMPAAFRPKWSSRKPVLAGGREVGDAQDAHGHRAALGQQRRPPPRPSRPRRRPPPR